MKNVVIVAVVLLVLAVLVLGSTKTASYVQGGRRLANEEVDARSPMRLESARIRALMDSERSKIATYEDRVHELQGRADGARQAVTQLNRHLEGERRALETARQLLEQRRERYIIGGQQYTFAQVNADAVKRVDEAKRLVEDIEFQESLLRDLEVAMAQGHKNLGEARNALQRMDSELARLETRNANADIRMQVANLTSSLSASPLGTDSEVERAFQNYERRVTQKERRASARLATANTSHLIDYSSVVVTEDARDLIDSFLNERTESSALPAVSPDYDAVAAPAEGQPRS